MNRVHSGVERGQRFESVFGQVFEPLQRYARRRIDPSRAEDVVADTLLVLWRQLDTVQAGAELPWCYGVARKCLANTRRSGVRQQRLVDRIASRSPTASPDSEGSAAVAESDVRQAMERLSVHDRELVELWAWEELEPREIAVVLGISANAVSIRLHRAKHRLRDLLDQRKETDPPGQQGVGTEERYGR